MKTAAPPPVTRPRRQGRRTGRRWARLNARIRLVAETLLALGQLVAAALSLARTFRP